jgi:signal transduction histidine kinase/ActR/RegA family two-component response regulator
LKRDDKMINNPAVSWPSGQGEMAKRVREHAWARTPLGPIDSWPQSLKTIVDMLLTSGFPTVAMWGPDLIQIYNDPYRAVIEARHPGALGRPTREIWSDYWAGIARIFDRVRTGETVRLVDERFTIPRGGVARDACFELSYSPLRDETGAVVGALAQALETTERVRSEAALRESEVRLRALVDEQEELRRQREMLLTEATESRAEAERANRAKDQFLITLSHELRTPLAPILLWARALRDGMVPPHEMKHAVDAIVISAESQLQLIEDLRDLSRLESGRMQLETHTNSVEDVARSAVEVIRPTARAKGVAVELDVTPDLGLAVLDRGRVQQVLWNLLSNAVKFTPDGGRVSLQVRRQNGRLEAVVSDTGQGIEADFLPHLFQRFRQGHTHERLRYGGLGVGLALCRYLVELHGGTIEGHSDGPGRGAVFTVRMPWIEPDADPRADVQDVLLPEGASLALRGLKVLLVEDDENMRDIMSWTLEGAGAVVIGAGSGPDALAALEKADRSGAAPDVMICDLGLPGMSGYELIGRIGEQRRADGGAAIPACAVTAFAREADLERAIEAGFDSYLAKPMTAQRLIEAVEELAIVAATDLSNAV